MLSSGGLDVGYEKNPHIIHMSCRMIFPTMWFVWPAKAQTSLCIHTVWSEPLLVTWIFYDLDFISLKGGCAGLSESTLVKMPHCWKSYVRAHINSKPHNVLLLHFYATKCNFILAVIPEYRTLLYANNKGTDQPAHQRSLISTFVIESLPAKNDIQTYFI